MEQITAFIQLDRTVFLGTPTIHVPFVWRFALFHVDARVLPFMSPAGPVTPYVINTVVIDNSELVQVSTMDALLRYRRDVSVALVTPKYVYIRMYDHTRLIEMLSYRGGVLSGYTNGEATELDGRVYRSRLLSQPRIEQQADAFAYARMSFTSATVELDNSSGEFDRIESVFGNDCNFLIAFGQANGLVKIRQFYVANVRVRMATCSLQLKDKRERLSSHVLRNVFTEEDYPFLDESYYDRPLQEAYGECLGIPGVCLHGRQIYEEHRPGTADLENKLQAYAYRFASNISRLDEIWVEMTSGEITVGGETRHVEGWTAVWRRELPPFGTPDRFVGWRPGIAQGDLSLLSDGIIRLDWRVAKRGGDRENTMNNVRVNGEFAGVRTPLAIVARLFMDWSELDPSSNASFWVTNNNSELSVLSPYPVGVFFDRSMLLYEAIEKLQTSSVLGFQLLVTEDRYAFKVDNPNRPKSFTITAYDILHLDDVEIDYNLSLYGTSTDIRYAYNHEQGEGRHAINDEHRLTILDNHRIERVWEQHSGLSRKQDAHLTGRILLDDFVAYRPIIRNIKLRADKWLGLSLYDMGWLDVSYTEQSTVTASMYEVRRWTEHMRHKLVGHVRTNEFIVHDAQDVTHTNRTFGAVVPCQVLSTSLDTATGVVTVSVRVREPSGALAAQTTQ